MIDVARAVFSQAEYRKTSPIADAAVKERDPLAMELEMITLVEDQSDAEALGQQILDLRQDGRFDWACAVTRGSVTARMGDTITIVYPRYGLDAGADFIIKRFRRDQSSPYDTMTLYGPKQ